MSTSSAHIVSNVRRSPRFRVNFSIKVFAVVQQRKCVLQGRTHDLCDEGMAIYIPAELQRGQVVQMQFTLPHIQQRLGVAATVRDCEGFRCGLEFENLTELEQKAIEECCEKLGQLQ